jgi:hypothetical protein
MKENSSLINSDGSMGIKRIYIDPSFATRREFRGKHDERAYQDKVAGEHFIEHLRKRLIFFLELLTDDRNE